MERKNNCKDAVEDNKNTDDCVDFQRVSAVATRWTLDFMFVSLCRHFKENNMEEFDETLSNFEAISQSLSLKAAVDQKQLAICAFLARVMHGKQLDVQYEDNDHIMPLMSAAKIWSDLKDTVADKSLFKKMSVLLFVQSVAVSLEKGQRLSASSALKWFEENYDLPKSLRAVVSTIVAERDTYHTFLMMHSFNHLRETVQSFLDDYLEKNPSDYLLKAATKVVQSSKKNGELKDLGEQDSSQRETQKETLENAKENMDTRRVVMKRKLMSTKFTDVWKPESCKKAVVCARRIPEPVISMKSENTSEIHQTRAPRQKWTSELDSYLKKGVKRHGVGRWSRILLDYDFEGRSGTMLKDRWRVLLKTHQVG